MDGSQGGDHDKESQRRSCDARLLGKGGAYAIITKPIARILELLQCVARGVGGQASAPPNESRAHRRWVWAASDLLIGRGARQSTNCPQEARSAHADGAALGLFS